MHLFCYVLLWLLYCELSLVYYSDPLLFVKEWEHFDNFFLKALKYFIYKASSIYQFKVASQGVTKARILSRYIDENP